MRALDRKIARDLWHMRGQALAISLVVAAGVAMYVMALGNFASLSETRDAYYERYRMADVFAGVKRAPENVARIAALLPGVAQVDSRITGQATLDIAGVDEPIHAQLVSYDPGRPEALGGLYLRAGRLISPGRMDEGLINATFAEAHGLSPGDRLAATVNGQDRQIEIVGIVLSPEFVYAIAPGSVMPDNRRYGVVWLSRESLAAAYDLDGAFNQLVLALMPNADHREVLAGLDDILAPYGGIGAHDRTDHVSDAFVSAEIDGLEAIGSIVPILFLVVAAFLVNIVMSRLIQTEREEIGLLKAFGYPNTRIAMHYLKLVLVIVGLGVAIGSAGGAWLGRQILEIYGEFFSFPFLIFQPRPSTFVTAGGVTLAAGALGTLSAMAKAVRLPPAEAMRPPAPARYRRIELSALKDLIGWSGLSVVRWFAQPTRMIGRHLLRSWGRALVTVFGIALSVAMLVSTMFFPDAIEVLIDVQFQVGQRQDAIISLTGPRNRDAARELARIPGVLAVEGMRTVPAELVAGHRTRNVAIIGLPEIPEMHRPLDRHLAPIEIPGDGILLSAKLAELLGVEIGDRVRVDVREGQRPQLEIRVAALADDYFGTSAYMSLAALNHALDAPGLINGANIILDPAEELAFYEAVKDLPGIAGIQLQSVALQMFRETMAENLYISIFFYVAFASLIAVGVVYNSARIALSERAREFATLRVMGFSRAEVSYILLGELAFLTVLAMPLGCGLGYLFSTAIIEAYRTDLMRIPLIVDGSTYAQSMLIVLIATALSGLLVRRQVDRLDLIAVLKTRE